MIEMRYIDAAEVRMDECEDTKSLIGYAVVWGAVSSDLGGFKERFREGAFTDFLSSQESDVRALVNHDSAKVIGRQSAGTLHIEEDSRGLFFRVSLPDTSYARDLSESVRRGDISGVSFGFTVAKNGASWNREDGKRTREVTRANLFEVSPVTWPAYSASEILNRCAPMPADAEAKPVNSIAHWRHKLQVIEYEGRNNDDFIGKSS